MQKLMAVCYDYETIVFLTFVSRRPFFFAKKKTLRRKKGHLIAGYRFLFERVWTA